jgi:hypothetical protein
VVAQAPRIDKRLVGALARLDDRSVPIAETNRRVGLVAEGLGLKRPSYQQARVILHELRSRRRSPDIGKTLFDIAYRAQPPTALIDDLAGV